MAAEPLSEELQLRICTELAHGTPLVKICKADGMPNPSTIYRHLRDDANFREIYKIARSDQGNTLADQILELANAPPPTYVDADGCLRADHAAVNARKIQLDNMRWVASHLNIAWSDRLALTGAEGEPLIPKLNPESRVYDIEIARRIAWLLTKGERAMDAQPKPPLRLMASEAVFTPHDRPGHATEIDANSVTP